MDKKLYDTAEAAFDCYAKCSTIVPEILFAWLVAEAHFASSVTQVQDIVLGKLPQNDIELELLVRTAEAYRNFRQGIERAERVKPQGDMHAIRPEKP